MILSQAFESYKQLITVIVVVKRFLPILMTIGENYHTVQLIHCFSAYIHSSPWFTNLYQPSCLQSLLLLILPPMHVDMLYVYYLVEMTLSLLSISH